MTDRLTKIEKLAGGYRRHTPVGRDVLALVEIARAAQEYVDCFNPDGTEREISDDAWNTLREKLAALDSEGEEPA